MENYVIYTLSYAHVHPGVTNTFTVSPTSLTLQPNETSAVISITVIDDALPENDLSSTISADSRSGSQQISIVILDNDCKQSYYYVTCTKILYLSWYII